MALTKKAMAQSIQQGPGVSFQQAYDGMDTTFETIKAALADVKGILRRTEMEQGTTLDRRTGCDRRTVGTYLYTGLERRALKHRRSGGPAVCIYCGKVCGDSRGWNQVASTIETTVVCRTGICKDCS